VPVDAALARVMRSTRRGGGGADRDVRAGACRRVARKQKNRGQPQRPEDETDCGSEEARREARGEP
jgi:hypothetical protein